MIKPSLDRDATTGLTSVDRMKPVFIVGCPRSGTTWVSLLMAQHPEIAVFQHAKFFHYLSGLQRWWLVKDQGGWGKSVVEVPASERGRAVDNRVGESGMQLSGILSEQELYDMCSHAARTVFRSVACRKSGAWVVVDKTPENSGLTKFIRKLFPDACFLHVIRDPRSVYCSLRSAGRSWARHEMPTKPIDGAQFWLSHVQRSLTIGRATDRYHSLRYEDLIDNGATVLGELFSWLGLESSRELCGEALEACGIDRVRKDFERLKMPQGFIRSGAKSGWHDELHPRDVRIIEYVAGDLMEQLGYERHFPTPSRRPARIWWHERCNRVFSRLDRNVRRTSRALLNRWRGRETDYPEWVLY